MTVAPLTLESIAPERRPSSERAAREKLLDHLNAAPIPDNERLANLANLTEHNTYAETLGEILACHEALSPIAHIQKTHVIAGDVTETLPALLERRPETLIALAYFDMDIYAPTKAALDLVLPRMPKGAVIGFGEAMHPDFPGETRAILETFDLRATRLQRFPTCPDLSFIVLE